MSGQTYTLTVRATDSTGMEAYIDVVIEVEPHPYDLNRSGTFEKEEVIEAINDYLFGTDDEQITKEQVLEINNPLPLRLAMETVRTPREARQDIAIKYRHETDRHRRRTTRTTTKTAATERQTG